MQQISVVFQRLMMAHVYNFQSSPQTLPQPLIFSEYAEGSGNNKYLEIYNPSSSSVDLNAYALLCVSNSPTNVGEYGRWMNFEMGATIPPNGTYIVAHPSADPYILAIANMTDSC